MKKMNMADGEEVSTYLNSNGEGEGKWKTNKGVRDFTVRA